MTDIIDNNIQIWIRFIRLILENDGVTQLECGLYLYWMPEAWMHSILKNNDETKVQHFGQSMKFFMIFNVTVAHYIFHLGNDHVKKFVSVSLKTAGDFDDRNEIKIDFFFDMIYTMVWILLSKLNSHSNRFSFINITPRFHIFICASSSAIETKRHFGFIKFE